MNVLYGLYQPTEGQILLDGKPVEFSGPGDAMAAGIGMVHQHFMLVPVFTVAENIALGAETTKAGGMLDLQVTRKKIREISDRYGFDVDPDAIVEDLPVGVQLISPAFKDENMFRAAAALETVYGTAPVAPAFADGKAGE